MGVNGISGYSASYGKLASGKRIQSAADDASGLAIGQKLQKETNGLDVGASNIKDGIGAANVKDGALSSIQDSLQRIHELSVKASNGLYGADEKQMIQDEVDQLLQGIEQTAKGTSFNEQKLLDGSMADMEIASNPDGTGMKIQMENATLSALGLDGYSVTGSIDFGALDNAMKLVSGARSSTGAVTNSMEHAYNYNTNASIQLTSARSRIEDLDMPQAVSEKKKEELLKNYQMGMMRKKMNADGLVLKLFQ